MYVLDITLLTSVVNHSTFKTVNSVLQVLLIVKFKYVNEASFN